MRFFPILCQISAPTFRAKYSGSASMCRVQPNTGLWKRSDKKSFETQRLDTGNSITDRVTRLIHCKQWKCSSSGGNSEFDSDN